MQPGAEQAQKSAEWVNKTVSWDKKVSQDRLIPQLSTGGEKNVIHLFFSMRRHLIFITATLLFHDRCLLF